MASVPPGVTAFSDADVRRYVDRWLRLEARYSGHAYDGSGTGLRVVVGAKESRIAVSAPHAVNHRRDAADKLADRGTGGLAELLAELVPLTALIVAARDSGDANWDNGHRLKTRLAGLQPRPLFVLDIHGMTGTDTADVEIGLGLSPTQASRALAQSLVSELATAGLNCSMDATYTARRVTTITSWAQLSLGIPAIQIELASAVRPPDGKSESLAKVVASLVRGLRRIDAALRRPACAGR